MAPPGPIGSKACAICHRRKVKCDLAKGILPCTNCSKSDFTCRPHVRKRARHDSTEDGRDEDSTLASIETSRRTKPLALFTSPGASSQAEHGPGHTPLDTHAVTSRTYLGRSGYIGGDVPFTEDRDAETEPHVSSAHTITQSSYHLPADILAMSRSTRASLIDAFMERCYPWMPIVERPWLEHTADTSPSPLLLYAVFLAGSRVSSATLYSLPSVHFYEKAKTLFFSGSERNAVLALVAACLLQWWSPTGPEQVSLDTSGFWASTGAFISYQVGLHIDPGNTPDNGFRRRLWWSLRARDSLISVAVGRPRIINESDSSVRSISLRDFHTVDSNAHLFCAYAPICTLLGDIAESHRRRFLRGPSKADFEEYLLRWARSVPTQLRLFHLDSDRSLAAYNFEAWQLWVPYLMGTIILERTSETSSSHTTACLVASSLIAAIFEDFSARDQVKHLGPVWAFYALAAGLCQLSAYRYRDLRRIAEQEILVLRLALESLAARWGSAQRALKSLNKAQTSVASLTLIDGLPDPLPSRSDTLFDHFGPSLCRMWHLRQSTQQNSDRTAAINDQDARDMDAAMLLSNLPTAMDNPPYSEAAPSSTFINPSDTDFLTSEHFPVLESSFQPIGSWLFDDFDFGLPGFDT